MATLTVQDTSLIRMADALRAGTGTTEPLTFPEEFVSKINILAAIGGGGMITPEDIGAVPYVEAYGADYNMDVILSGGAHFSFYKTNGETLGTPYNKGKIMTDAAIILSYASSINYGFQMAMPAGSDTMLWRTLNGTTIGDWSFVYSEIHKPTATDIGAIPAASKGTAGGVATLNNNLKVSAEQACSTITAKTSNYTLTLEDAGTLITMNAETDLTLTIPAGGTINFPIGTEIEVAQFGAGKVTISPESGVTLYSLDGALSLAGQYAVACIKKVSTNAWLIGGALA